MDDSIREAAEKSLSFLTSAPGNVLHKSRDKVTSLLERVRSNEEASDPVIIKHQKAHKLREADEVLRGVLAQDIANATLDAKLSKEFLDGVATMCHSYLCDEFDRNEKVLDFRHPAVMREEVGHLLQMSKRDGVDAAHLLQECDFVLKNCVRTGHPRFFNQISNGIDVVSLVGEWITATVNTNMFTYEISPVFVLMEDAIMKKLLEIVGFNLEISDGIFSPGGTVSNLYAVLAARLRACPELRMKGLNAGKPLVLFTSNNSHYSVHRSGVIAGLGLQNVVEIDADDKGKMDVAKLEEAIEEAKRQEKLPFLVVATAGTTVLGAYDPIKEIAQVAKKNNMWLHVDAAWGGGALMSSKHRHKLDGIEMANSATWNPHKMMGITLQCSVFLTQDKTVLCEMNSMSAEYLFQQDKHYDVSYDTGDKSLQCGRRNDVFKLWLSWRSKGLDGFEKKINHLFDLAAFSLFELKRRSSNFVAVLDEVECTNICFWYVPNCLKTDGSTQAAFSNSELLAQVAPLIKGRMMERGRTMVGYQPLGDKPNFFRLIISSSAATPEDVIFLYDEIESIGKSISIEDLESYNT